MPIDPALDPLFAAAGRQYDVDPNLLRAVALTESGANPRTPDSPAGAEGIMQFLPQTAREMGVENPYDPVQAIPGAARYLAQGLAQGEALQQRGLAVDPAAYAVMYYHGGPDTAQWGPRTHAYVRTVAGRYGNLAPAADARAGSGDAAPLGATPMPQALNNPDAGLPPDLLQLAAAGVSDVDPRITSGEGARPRGFLSPDLATLAGAGAGMASGSPAMAAGGPSAGPMAIPVAAATDAAASAAAPGVLPEIARLSDEHLIAGLDDRTVGLRAPEPAAPGTGAARLVPVDHDPFAAPAAGAGGVAIPGSSPGTPPAAGRTPPPGAAPVTDLNGLLRSAEAAERAGLPDLANNYRSTYQNFVTSGLMPYSDGQLYPIPGGPRDPGMIRQQAGAEAVGRAQATAPYDMVDAVVQGPNGPVRMQIPKDQYLAQLHASGGAAAPGVGSGMPGTAPGGVGGPALAGAAPPASAAASLPGAVATPQPGGTPPIGTLTGAPVMTPEQAKTSEAYGDQAADVIDAANKAPDILGKAQILKNAAAQFQDSSFGGFGPSAQQRLDMANKFVDLANQFGVQVQPGVKNMIAAGQIIGKEQGMLTAELVRQLGSREAAQIYNATQAYTPGVTMSQGGYNAIVSSIEQGAQRDLDKAKFQDGWLGSHPSVAGMMTEFNKWNPIDRYASQVAPIPVGQAGGKYIPGAIYVNRAGRRAKFQNGQMQPVP